MNILHVNFSDIGGAAIASKSLHEELLQQGIDSNYLVINLTQNYIPEKKYYSHRRIYKSLFDRIWHLRIKAALINRINSNLLDIATPFNEVITSPYTCFDVLKDPLYDKADVIHLHLTANFIDWPSFFKKNKKPIVWTLHDKNPFSGILHCSNNFPENGKETEKKIKFKKEKWIKNSNITVISPSRLYKKHSLASKVLQKFNHKVIHHGVSSNLFFPIKKEEIRAKLNIPYNKKILLSIATDLNRNLKGFKEVIETAKKMIDITFILVGSRTENSNNFPNILYTGHIKDRTLLNEWYNCADGTISNSKEESFGLTVAESLKAGTPVLMKDTGMFRDLINDDNGLEIKTSLIDTINLFYKKSYTKQRVIKSIGQKLENKTFRNSYIETYNSLC